MAETQEQEPAKVRQILQLKNPLDSVDRFVVGENCDAIERVDGGAYEVFIGSKMRRVESGRVDYFEQDPRPGWHHEQANNAGELPSWAKREADGSFTCKLCTKNTKKLHALRVHYGTTHGGER